jgi:hypothetical protein
MTKCLLLILKMALALAVWAIVVAYKWQLVQMLGVAVFFAWLFSRYEQPNT